MLRITVTGTISEQRWILQGRLTGSSTAELMTNWRASRRCPPSQNCVVDLNEVTSIDKEGEQGLLMMIRDGAKFCGDRVIYKASFGVAFGTDRDPVATIKYIFSDADNEAATINLLLDESSGGSSP